MKRKFINFTDDELDVLTGALKNYDALSLLKQANEEIRTREYNRKRDEERTKNHPEIYCC